ncbi:hypothetical protein LIER_31135 [Lithospermum erythrorhizon]|uniref:F-box associated beta-propeller type 3 domain-containing protein n=1 Tax=Lithospermum erythrorhizon TaxID=34254 RepID=A0AAV3RVB5_LITER
MILQDQIIFFVLSLVINGPFGDIIIVGNPVTRKTLELPRLSLPTFRYRCCLAFEACSEVYKVVVVYMTEKHSYGPFNLNLGCAILTVGVDAEWRVVSCAHLEEEDMKVLMLGSPVTSTGLVYWSSILHHDIMVLDIKSETIKTISLPYAYGTSYPCLPKLNSISIWYLNSDCSMEVWLLKDHHMNEEWVKILYIDGEPIRNRLDEPFPSNELYPGSPKYYDVHPRCWLGNDERILFEVALDVSYFFVYDVKTCSCSWFALENDDSCNSQLEPFVNTLAWVC